MCVCVMCMYSVGMLPTPSMPGRQVKTLFQNLQPKNVVFLVVTVDERGFPIPNYILVASTWVFPKIVDSPKWMVYNGKPYENG